MKVIISPTSLWQKYDAHKIYIRTTSKSVLRPYIHTNTRIPSHALNLPIVTRKEQPLSYLKLPLLCHEREVQTHSRKKSEDELMS